MAFGYDSHAKVNDGVALGAWSVADTAAGASGYDPSTQAASTIERPPPGNQLLVPFL